MAKDYSYLDQWRKDYEAKRDSLTEQKCTKCGETKPIERFAKRKLRSGNFGYEKTCRDCRSVHVKDWVRKNPDIRKSYGIKQRKPKVKRICLQCKKEYESTRNKNKEYCSKECKRIGSLHPRVWVYQTKEERKAKAREYRKKPEVILARRERQRQRLLNDVNYKLRHRLPVKVVQSIKGIKVHNSALKLLGCDIEYFKQYIESQFKEGMSWDNWNSKGWHLDHIKPISSFDLTKEEQLNQCFHYTNLQPLWARENLHKAAKIITKQLVLI